MKSSCLSQHRAERRASEEFSGSRAPAGDAERLRQPVADQGNRALEAWRRRRGRGGLVESRRADVGDDAALDWLVTDCREHGTDGRVVGDGDATRGKVAPNA